LVDFSTVNEALGFASLTGRTLVAGSVFRVCFGCLNSFIDVARSGANQVDVLGSKGAFEEGGLDLEKTGSLDDVVAGLGTSRDGSATLRIVLDLALEVLSDEEGRNVSFD